MQKVCARLVLLLLSRKLRFEFRQLGFERCDGATTACGIRGRKLLGSCQLRLEARNLVLVLLLNKIGLLLRCRFDGQ